MLWDGGRRAIEYCSVAELFYNHVLLRNLAWTVFACENIPNFDVI